MVPERLVIFGGITIMNIVEAYLKFEDILSEYYFTTSPKLGNLGAMMGENSTKIHKPQYEEPIVSGDPSVFEEDWTEAWNRVVGEGKDGTNEQVFQVAEALISYYENEVNYDLGDVETYLREKLDLPKNPRQVAV
jgi:hypothetical protein